MPLTGQNVWIAKGGSDTTGDGSRKKPYATHAKISTLITALTLIPTLTNPLTVWAGPGTYSEQVPLLNYVTWRGYYGRPLVDRGSVASTAGFLHQTTKTGWAVIGYEIAHADVGFAINGTDGDGTVIDTKSHDNLTNGFGTLSPGGSEKARVSFIGCEAYANAAGDGFSGKSFVKIKCYSCTSHGHTFNSSSDGFTDHDHAPMECYDCVSYGNSNGFGFTQNDGTNIVARCIAYGNVCCSLKLDPPTATSSEVIIYACSFSTAALMTTGNLGNVTVNVGATAHIFKSTLENLNTSANNIYNVSARAATSKIRMIGCQLLLSALNAGHNKHMGFFNAAVGLELNHNVYEMIAAGVANTIFDNAVGAGRTFAQWQTDAQHFDSFSVYGLASSFTTAVPLSNGSTTMTPDNARATPLITDPLVNPMLGRCPNLVQYFAANPTEFDTSRFADWGKDLNGQVIDLSADFWDAGPFGNAVTTPMQHAGYSASGGVFSLYAKQINSDNLIDQRINKVSIKGDQTKRVKILSGTIQGDQITKPGSYRITSGKAAANLTVLVGTPSTTADSNSTLNFPRFGRPGEDLYLQVFAPADGGLFYGELAYLIETIAVPVDSGMAVVDA